MTIFVCLFASSHIRKAVQPLLQKAAFQPFPVPFVNGIIFHLPIIPLVTHHPVRVFSAALNFVLAFWVNTE